MINCTLCDILLAVSYAPCNVNGDQRRTLQNADESGANTTTQPSKQGRAEPGSQRLRTE